MSLSPMTADQEATFQAWRAMAMDKMPYFARILFALRVLNAPGLGTWAVDGGYRMYIDFDAVVAKGTTWNVESVLHECSHLFAEHKQSAQDLGVTPANAKVWNVAADFSINDDLDQAGCKTFRSDQMLPEFIGEENGQTPHYYFGVLTQKMQQQAQRNQQQNNQQGRPDPNCPQHGQQNQQQGSDPCSQDPQQGSQGDTQQDGGQGSDSQNGNQPGQQPGGSGHQHGQSDPACTCPGQNQHGQQGQVGSGEQSGPFKGCGSGSGGESWSGELAPGDDFGGLAPAAGDIEKESIRLATAAAIKDHVAKGRGTVPGGLVGIADKILAPSKTPWQQILGSKIRRTVGAKAGTFDADPTRRNRRRHNAEISGPHGSRKAIFPGYFTPVPSIEIIRDTSGSMSATDLAVVTREVEAIAKKIGIRGEQLIVTDVDAAVHASKGYKGRDSIREVHGRGGTDMVVGIEAAQSRKDRPTAIIVVTDGWTPWPEERGKVPVIACIVAHDPKMAEKVVEMVPDFVKTVVADPAE